MFSLAFADDVALVAKAKETYELKDLLYNAASHTSAWLTTVRLKLTIQKSEAIVFTNNRTHNDMTITIDGVSVKASGCIKYLGYLLDPKFKFTHGHWQIRQAMTTLERQELYNLSSQPELRAGVRGSVIQRWQERWDSATTGRWIRRLLDNVSQWYGRRHGEMSFHLSQAFFGHGCFAAYLHR